MSRWAYPRDIFRPVIVHSAYSFILAHNHPSGDPSPSEADLRLTRRRNEAARILQIQILDHVIIGEPMNDRQGYFSFKEAGTIGQRVPPISRRQSKRQRSYFRATLPRYLQSNLAHIRAARWEPNCSADSICPLKKGTA